MFAYCQNNPIIYMDPCGDRIVGVGFQFEIKSGDISIGMEIIVYFNSKVCNDSDHLIVAYSYSGYEVSLGQILGFLDIIDTAALATLVNGQTFEQDALLALARMALSGAGLSGGVFVIDLKQGPLLHPIMALRVPFFIHMLQHVKLLV